MQTEQLLFFSFFNKKKKKAFHNSLTSLTPRRGNNMERRERNDLERPLFHISNVAAAIKHSKVFSGYSRPNISRI